MVEDFLLAGNWGGLLNDIDCLRAFEQGLSVPDARFI